MFNSTMVLHRSTEQWRDRNCLLKVRNHYPPGSSHIWRLRPGGGHAPRVQDCAQPLWGFSQDLPLRNCIRARFCAKPLSHEPPGNTPPIDLPSLSVDKLHHSSWVSALPPPIPHCNPAPPSKQFASSRPASKIEGFCWPPACVSQTINNMTAGVSLTGMFIVLLTGRR